jgi:NAD(P)-dependent dehydrogenase (short-subunit alcohol dehydrogenase family)
MALAQLGGRVVALGRDEDRLQHTLNQMQGSNHLKVNGNLSSADAAFETLKDARALVDDKIDGIFHGAGVAHIRPARLTKTKHIDEIMGASLFGALGIARAAASRNFCADGGASVIFMSSVAGERGQVGMSAYGASRAAISGLVKNLACELAPQKIRVNSIIAGAVETEMHAEISRGMDENSLDDYKKKHLLGFGQVQDIADAAAFLMGPASKWITGTSMIVDGGYMAK